MAFQHLAPDKVESTRTQDIHTDIFGTKSGKLSNKASKVRCWKLMELVGVPLFRWLRLQLSIRRDLMISTCTELMNDQSGGQFTQAPPRSSYFQPHCPRVRCQFGFPCFRSRYIARGPWPPRPNRQHAAGSRLWGPENQETLVSTSTYGLSVLFPSTGRKKH